jgi:hypothetical protein
MSVWGEEWTYFPTEGARRMGERLQGQIEQVRLDLHDRNESRAAAAFEGMLADNLTRLEITNAVTRFHLDRTGQGGKVRQGDVLELSKRLKALLDEVAQVQYLLARRRVSLDGIPGLPDVSEISRRGDDALEGAFGLSRLADDLHRAVTAEHGEDTGGPAVSERLAGDPLDRLADALAVPWQRHGGGLTGAALTDFMRVLRAVHEAETKEQDIPERAEKRISKSLRSGT